MNGCIIRSNRRFPADQPILQPLMNALLVEVRHVIAPITRSQIAFAFGLATGDRNASIPSVLIVIKVLCYAVIA